MKELEIVYLAPKELIPYENNPRMNEGGYSLLLSR